MSERHYLFTTCMCLLILLVPFEACVSRYGALIQGGLGLERMYLSKKKKKLV